MLKRLGLRAYNSLREHGHQIPGWRRPSVREAFLMNNQLRDVRDADSSVRVRTKMEQASLEEATIVLISRLASDLRAGSTVPG